MPFDLVNSRMTVDFALSVPSGDADIEWLYPELSHSTSTYGNQP
jgi:hypothetical protein